VIGLDVMIVVGLLRFGLDLPERKGLALLRDGCHLDLVQSSFSRLSTEFLVRWRMLCEERLPAHASELGPLVVQVDATMTPGSASTCRARHALTGATLWAEQLEVEDKEEVRRFVRAFRSKYGTPALWIRDQSTAIRGALNEEFPFVPQQEDHWHFLQDLGVVVLPDYEPCRRGLVGGKGLADLAHWSRDRPLEGATLAELERVWVRLALEWVEEGRAHPGGFPFRLPYVEVARRLEQIGIWSRTLMAANGRWNCVVADVGELRRRVDEVLDREAVRVTLGRLRSEVRLWEEIRSAMRAERSRRSREDLEPLSRVDVSEAKRRIEEAGGRFAAQGEWAEEIWSHARSRFEDHELYLWAEVPGMEVVLRSSVALERAHAADRRGVRHRRGQEATGEEMGHLGSLLAFWSNTQCPWFAQHVLPGVNLWEVFAGQDSEEVRRRLEALPREGRPPRVEAPRGKAGERLERFVKLLTSRGPIEPGLTAWAVSVGAEPV